MKNTKRSPILGRIAQKWETFARISSDRAEEVSWDDLGGRGRFEQLDLGTILLESFATALRHFGIILETCVVLLFDVLSDTVLESI